MKKVFLHIVVLLIATCCSIEPQPINYGKDACHYCKMSIVDRQHNAEIVTKKGKAFKYDAIECMVRDIGRRDENEIALFLIADYTIPGKLVDATRATYLISATLPSPMGANLTGFEHQENAIKIQQKMRSANCGISN